MSKNVFERVSSLLKTYKGEDDKKFAADYRTAISEGSRSGQLSAEQVAALDRIRETIDQWQRRSEEAPANPIEQWRKLAEDTRDHLPSQLLAMVLSRIPREALKAVDWSRLILAEADRALLSLLAKRRLIKPSDLIKVAKAKPSEFYSSPGLDILLEDNACPPRSVWKTLDERPERGNGLLPGPEALAEAYVLDTAGDASPWFVALVANNERTRSSVLRQVLRDPAASEKLARYLSAAGAGLTGKKRATAMDAASVVIEEFVEACAEAIEGEKRTQESAAWVLSMLTLGANAPATKAPPAAAKSIDRVAGRVAHSRILAVLRAADAGQGGGRRALAANEKDLYEAVQEYLQSLPSGGSQEGAPAERAARYQRYVGRREVIQELLPLVQETGDMEIRRATLEAALFNVGLRHLGVSGDQVTFDSRIHAALVSGILPGDTVRIARPGWQIGDDDATVLEKAQVTAQD